MALVVCKKIVKLCEMDEFVREINNNKFIVL